VICVYVCGMMGGLVEVMEDSDWGIVMQWNESRLVFVGQDNRV